MKLCLCGSNQTFEACCGPLLAGEPAATAEALMRSRYSAFVLGDLDYLVKTAAGEAALKFNRSELERSLPGTQWLGLEILEVEGGQQTDISGSVKFRARFRDSAHLGTLVERSEFRRIDSAWRYFSGDAEISSGPVANTKTGRNDPCPCGSGRKYKKCCGA